jgi:hypothetical protein
LTPLTFSPSISNAFQQSRSGINRTQIQRLENAFSELGELASRPQLPREFLKALHALHHALQLGHGTGLSDDQLRQRLDKLRELRILPEDRIAP